MKVYLENCLKHVLPLVSSFLYVSCKTCNRKNKAPFPPLIYLVSLPEIGFFWLIPVRMVGYKNATSHETSFVPLHSKRNIMMCKEWNMIVGLQSFVQELLLYSKSDPTNDHLPWNSSQVQQSLRFVNVWSWNFGALRAKFTIVMITRFLKSTIFIFRLDISDAAIFLFPLWRAVATSFP